EFGLTPSSIKNLFRINAPELFLVQIARIAGAAAVLVLVDGGDVAPGAVAFLDDHLEARSQPCPHAAFVRAVGAQGDFTISHDRGGVAGADAGKQVLVHPAFGAVDVPNLAPGIELLDDFHWNAGFKI